jgi:hypothetical protein
MVTMQQLIDHQLIFNPRSIPLAKFGSKKKPIKPKEEKGKKKKNAPEPPPRPASQKSQVAPPSSHPTHLHPTYN